MKQIKKCWLWLAVIAIVLSITGCKAEGEPSTRTASVSTAEGVLQTTDEAKPRREATEDRDPEDKPNEDSRLYTKEEVAAYIHTYGRLPENYITKAEAEKRGWSVKRNDGYVIGGDKFGNREGRLPKKKGRQYFECDLIDGYGSNRGSKRLVFSNDGLIFYTDDHYEHFEQLY